VSALIAPEPVMRHFSGSAALDGGPSKNKAPANQKRQTKHFHSEMFEFARLAGSITIQRITWKTNGWTARRC